ncbi:MAG: helix-turn-helix domain-containing protein [Candidatus Aminicenantales bacterium]
MLTKQEVQEYLNISHQTLQRLMRFYGLPYIKLGRRVLIDPQALQAWVEARTVNANVEDPAGYDAQLRRVRDLDAEGARKEKLAKEQRAQRKRVVK